MITVVITPAGNGLQKGTTTWYATNPLYVMHFISKYISKNFKFSYAKVQFLLASKGGLIQDSHTMFSCVRSLIAGPIAKVIEKCFQD